LDEEKEVLKRQLAETEEQKALLEQRLYIREKLSAGGIMDQPGGTGPKKKERADKTACSDGRGAEASAGSSVQGGLCAGGAGILKPDEVEKPDQATEGTGLEAGAREVR
jgi:hypothetical protein